MRHLATPRHLIEIQANDLYNYKMVLKPAAYAALESRTLARRHTIAPQDMDRPQPLDELEHILRGDDLRLILSEVMAEFRHREG